MSDNTTLSAGTGGDTIRDLARQSGTVKTQVMQLDIGGPSANAEVLATAGQQLSTASLPVVWASDKPLPAGTNSIGAVLLSNASGAITSANPLQVAGGFTASATLTATYNSTAPTLTSGQSGPLQTDVNGNLKVTGSFSATTTVTYNTTPPTLTNGQTAPLQSDVNGNLKVAGTFWPATQPVSLAVLPALPAGGNIIGNMGSLNIGPVVGATSTGATAYPAGACIGGVQSVAFFRSTAPASGTLDQMLIGWLGAETAAVTVFLFAKNPGNSTGLTDAGTPAFAAADLKYLLTAPFTLTPAAPAQGTTKVFATQNLSLSAKNQDTAVTTNIYAVFVANAAVTPAATGDLMFSFSGVQD